MTQEFQFEESTHTYREGGLVIPSCTRVLDHSGLADFGFVNREILERRSWLGTHVHTCTEYVDTGGLDWSSVDEEAKGYVDSWINFCSVHNFRPSVREYQCIANINGMRYGMRLDAAGLFHKRFTIADMKIGTEQLSHPAQLAGYSAGLPIQREESELMHDAEPNVHPLARFSIRGRIGVYLKKNGKAARCEQFENPEDYQAFYCGLYMTHYKLKHGKEITQIDQAA